MKKIYIALLIVSKLFVWSCTNDPMERERPRGNPNFNPRNEATTTLLFRGETIYSKIFQHDAAMIGFLSGRHNPLAEENLVIMDAVRRPVSSGNAARTRTQNAPTNGLQFRINGIDAQDIRKEQATQQLRNSRAGNSLFGNTVTFSLSHTNTGNEDVIGTRSASEGTEITMYVPKLVEILSPRVETAQDLLPFVYYRSFILEWNADPQNENGLVVAVEWNGIDMFGKHHRQYVLTADILPIDNGSAILNNQMFERIPQGAIANLILLRGNIELIEGFINEHGEEEAFRLVAASEATLPFIMVREITLIEE